MSVTDKPSRRNKYVRVEKPTQTTTAGKTSETWSFWCHAWVSIEPVSGREGMEVHEQQSSITHLCRGLYAEFDTVTADFRIVWDSRTFHLLEAPRNLEEANVIYEMAIEEETR
jgi:head-tail adaptor